MDTDTHCLSELGLGQANEAAKRGDIVARLDLAVHQPSADASWNCPRHLRVRELGDLCHGGLPPT
jgi:hypothetical protein